jgi:hypothetical protein
MIGENLTGPKGDMWACQVGAAALLRLEYALIAAHQLELKGEIDENTCARMLDVVEDDGALPELILEIVRILLLTWSSRFVLIYIYN